MRELLVEHDGFSVYYASHCDEYSCAACDPCIQVSRGPGGASIWHKHEKSRWFGRNQTLDELLDEALRMIAGWTAYEGAERERVQQLKEEARIRAEVLAERRALDALL
jgi:hypothetical protein